MSLAISPGNGAFLFYSIEQIPKNSLEKLKTLDNAIYPVLYYEQLRASTKQAQQADRED